MLHYLIELALWMLGFFVAGCCIGCLLNKLFGADEQPAAAVAAPAPAPIIAPRAAVKPVAATPLAMAPRMSRPRGIATARSGKPDNLLRISGVGPKNEKILHALGFFHFDQIAAWTAEQVNWIDDHLQFGGRITREEWINQARLLAVGNESEFASLYGTGGEGARPVGVPETAATLVPAEQEERDAAAGKTRKPKGIAAARGGKADNLQRISGIGPKNEIVLHGLGFFHFDQVADWTATEIAWVDDHLKFGGRIKRERWINQARLLADGKETEFTKQYGSGGLKNRKGESLSGTKTRRKT